MKWFLTGDSIGLAEMLEAAGETVVSLPKHYRTSFDDVEEPPDYTLQIQLRAVGNFDVLVLDGFFAEPGYAKRHVVPWGGAVRGRCVVGIGTNDPDDYRTAREKWRGCVCGMAQISVYVSDDPDTVNKAASSRFAVFWEGELDPLLRAVEDICKYQQVRADGRIYKGGGNVHSV